MTSRIGSVMMVATAQNPRIGVPGCTVHTLGVQSCDLHSSSGAGQIGDGANADPSSPPLQVGFLRLRAGFASASPNGEQSRRGDIVGHGPPTGGDVARGNSRVSQ